MFAPLAKRLFPAVFLLAVGIGPATQKEDERPVVPDLAVTRPALNPALPTLFLVGDSTMNSNAPLRGWASEVAPLLDTSKINVAVRAIGGRSSKTFLLEGRWDKVLAEIKPGDIVIVQFGHNDGGRYDDPNAKWRPSLRGEDDATAELSVPDPRGGPDAKQTIHTFGWYMRNYASTAKSKGATVILASMVPHKSWKDGKIERGERASFVLWTQHAAEATGTIFLDLNEAIAEKYEALGVEKVESLFGDARTHFSPAGAKFAAQVAINSLKQLPNNPLGLYTRP